jgi:hypothetical protein
LALVADRLHGRYGSYVSCKSCTSSGRDRKGNYNKNVAGKRDGEERYYRRWCCTTNGKFSCPSLSNTAYIDWAKTQLSRDSFRAVVETLCGGFEDKGPEHCRLGLLLQDEPFPTTGNTSLKRKATTVQVTPPPTKRRLNFFTLGGAGPPSTSVTSYRKDEEAYVTPASSTLDVGKVGLTHSPRPELIAGLTEIRTKLNQLIADYGEEDIRERQEEKQVDCDKTRENSLSPEEYLGIHEAKDLALQATVRPITTPDLSSPPHRRLASTGTSIERLPSSADGLDAPQSDVEEGLPAISLAAILAASFHSANASEKKEIRRQAKQENVVAAFEEEIRRIGILARTLT